MEEALRRRCRSTCQPEMKADIRSGETRSCSSVYYRARTSAGAACTSFRLQDLEGLVQLSNSNSRRLGDTQSGRSISGVGVASRDTSLHLDTLKDHVRSLWRETLWSAGRSSKTRADICLTTQFSSSVYRVAMPNLNDSEAKWQA